MKLKMTLMVIVLSASFTAPAFASEEPIAALPQFTAADTQLMFEKDAEPMQLAALSSQEMQETEGAQWQNIPNIAASAGSAALANIHGLTRSGINFANAGSQPGAGTAASFLYGQVTGPSASQPFIYNPAAHSAAVNSIPRP